MVDIPSWMKNGSDIAPLESAKCTGGGTLYTFDCPNGQCVDYLYEAISEEDTLCKHWNAGNTVHRAHMCFLLNKLKDKQNYAQEYNPSWGTRSNICEFADPVNMVCTRGDVPDAGGLGGDGEISRLYADTKPPVEEILVPGEFGTGGTEYTEDVCGDDKNLNGTCHYVHLDNAQYGWKDYLYDLSFNPTFDESKIIKIRYSLNVAEAGNVANAYDTGEQAGILNNNDQKAYASSVRFVVDNFDINGYMKITTNCGSIIYKRKRLGSFTTIELPLSLHNGKAIEIEINIEDQTGTGVLFSKMQLYVPMSMNNLEQWNLSDINKFEYHGKIDPEEPGPMNWLEIDNNVNNWTGGDLSNVIKNRIGYNNDSAGIIVDNDEGMDVPEPPPISDVSYFKTIGTMPYYFYKEPPIYDGGGFNGYQRGTSNNLLFISRGLINLFNVLVDGWTSNYDRTAPATSTDLSWFTNTTDLARGTPVGSGEYGTKNIRYDISHDASNMRDFVIFKRENITNDLNSNWPTPPNDGFVIMAKHDGTVEKISAKFCWKPFSVFNYGIGYTGFSLHRIEDSISTYEYWKDYLIYTGRCKDYIVGLNSAINPFNPLGINSYQNFYDSYRFDAYVNPKFLTNSIPIKFPLYHSDATWTFGTGELFYEWQHLISGYRETQEIYGYDTGNIYKAYGWMAAGTVKNPRTFVIKKLYLENLESETDEFPKEIEIEDYEYNKFTGRIIMNLYDEYNYEIKGDGTNEFYVYSRTNPESLVTKKYKLRVNYLENPCPYGDCNKPASLIPAGYYVPRLSWGFLNFSAHPNGFRNVNLWDGSNLEETFWYGISPTMDASRINNGFLDNKQTRNLPWGNQLHFLWNSDNNSGSIVFRNHYFMTEIWRTVLWLRRYVRLMLSSPLLPVNIISRYPDHLTNQFETYKYKRFINWTYAPGDDVKYYVDYPGYYVYLSNGGHDFVTKYVDFGPYINDVDIKQYVLWNPHEVIRKYVTLNAEQYNEMEWCNGAKKEGTTVAINMRQMYYNYTTFEGNRFFTQKGRCVLKCLYCYEKTIGDEIKYFCRKSCYTQYDPDKTDHFIKTGSGLDGLFLHDDTITNIEVSNKECPNPNFCGGTVCFVVGTRTGPPSNLALYYTEPAVIENYSQINMAYEMSYYAVDANYPHKIGGKTPIIDIQTLHPFTGVATLNIGQQSTMLYGQRVDQPTPVIDTTQTAHRFVWIELTAECDKLEIYEGARLLRRFTDVQFAKERVDFVSYYPATLRIVVTSNTSSDNYVITQPNFSVDVGLELNHTVCEWSYAETEYMIEEGKITLENNKTDWYIYVKGSDQFFYQGAEIPLGALGIGKYTTQGGDIISIENYETGIYGAKVDAIWTIADLNENNINWMKLNLPFWTLGSIVDSSNEEWVADGLYWMGLGISMYHRLYACGHDQLLEQDISLGGGSIYGVRFSGVVAKGYALQQYTEPLMLSTMKDLNNYIDAIGDQKYISINRVMWENSTPQYYWVRHPWNYNFD